MKKYIFVFISIFALALTGCDDVLERPQLTQYVDDPANYWRNEDDIRLYCNEYYPQYFSGYNSAFGLVHTPLRGYTFNDDIASTGVQSSFPTTTPGTVASTTLRGADWRTQWNGQMWNFAWVRKSNIMLDRIENVAKNRISDEAYKHWTAVGRFFRAFEYHRLVITFGDVPYYDAPVDETDLESAYKDRDPRGMVMDKVYEDLKYALENIRESDGSALNVNRYIVAGYISNIMLFEGTWQTYHNLDQGRAKKYLELCVSAAEVVMNSGKYNFSKDFRSIFGSDDLKGHPEVIMYRHYAAGMLTHCLASYSNGIESQGGFSSNLALVKSFICSDGKPYQESGVADADNFHISSLVKTRDPRFESTFFDVVHQGSETLLYSSKFISREGSSFYFSGATLPDKYKSSTNTGDAPCLRLAEVVLNWIEAKAVLAEKHGGAAVTQADLDKSINAIRKRPLDAEAVAKGLQQTTALTLTDLPNDPERDSDVTALMWEIRRERRMEFVHEHTRLLDIKRWKKIEYMDNKKYPDTMAGPWVNISVDMPTYLHADNVGKLSVRKADGTIVTYNGSNGADLIGFYIPINASPRLDFGDEVYLSPVGKNQIQDYKDMGFTLTQTPGWENK